LVSVPALPIPENRNVGTEYGSRSQESRPSLVIFSLGRFSIRNVPNWVTDTLTIQMLKTEWSAPVVFGGGSMYNPNGKEVQLGLTY